MKTQEMSEGMKKTIGQFVSAKTQLDRELQNYLLGCMAGLGLEGNWQVNLEAGMFEQKEEEE